jgi:hypothetical protein
MFFYSCSVSEKTESPPETEFLSKEDLDAKYKSEWDKPEYSIARTASGESYLSEEEQEMFYYLNLVRINPSLFARTYAADYNGDEGWLHGYAWDERKQSLLDELSEMEPLPLLYPDLGLYETAECFARESGQIGAAGHDRSGTSCTNDWHAECCSYGGAKNGLSVIMSLLIDAGENNASLGHRRICLDVNYVRMGVAIRPHIKYQFNAVLDFKRKN